MDSVKPLELLREQLKSDAAPITADLRTSWNTISAQVTLDAGGPGADTLDSFAEIVKDIYHGVEACQQDEENIMSSEDWSQVYNAGLPDLILDIIMDNHFFSLPRPYLVEWILNIHLRLSYINDDWVKTQSSRALQRLDALWAAFWDNRHRITNWSWHRPPGIGEHPVMRALEAYHSIHELTKIPVSWSSRIHHYALYAWATAELPTKYFGSVFLCETGLQGPAYSPTTFIREAVIDGVGIDVCFSRLEAVLRGDDPWHWDRLDDLRCSLNLFGGLILNGDAPEATMLVVAAGQHRIPQLAVSIAKKHSLVGGLRASPGFYNAVFSVLIKATRYDCITNWSREHNDKLLVPGEDVLAITACAIDLLSMHGDESEMPQNARAAMVSVVNFLSSVLEMYYDRVKALKGVPIGDRMVHQSELLAGLKRGALEHWWQSLRRIEDAKRRCNAHNENIVQYSALWMGFGALLGCDPKRERQRDAREAAGRCTRSECEYHKKPSKKQLLRCKGCGVYYCGRECQVEDWKNGHKKECRRLNSTDVGSRP